MPITRTLLLPKALLAVLSAATLSGCMTQVYKADRSYLTVKQERTTVGELIGVHFTKTRVDSSQSVNGVSGLETYSVGLQFGFWPPLGVYEVGYPLDESAIQHNSQALAARMLGR